MASIDFHMKQGDTKPSIQATLYNGTTPLDLTGTTVRFKMRRPQDTTLLINEIATLVDAANGVVRYDWDATDLATAERTYRAEWEITYADDSVLTVPRPGWLSVFVHPDLD